jgi:hypothetical protein
VIRPGDITAVLDCLLIIRESLEQGTSYVGRDAEVHSIYLTFEAMRFPLASSVSETKGDNRSIQRLQEAVQRFYFDFGGLLQEERFTEVTRSMPTARKARRRDTTSESLREVLSVGPRTIDLHRFARMLHEALEGGLSDVQEDLFSVQRGGSQMDQVRALQRIVPKQKVAPVHFDISNGQLVVLSTTSSLPTNVRQATVSAKEDLSDRGTKLLEQLKNSNCDRRLLESAAELQIHLESGKDIVRLGLANIGFGILSGKFDSELPEAISALMQAHTVGVGMYVAQFPDWAKFTENAASIEIGQQDLRALSGLVSDLISVTSNQELADAQVPRTLRQLNALLADPRGASSRVALAAIRTVENLVIKVFGYGAEFFEKTAEKSIELGSGVTSKTIVGALLGIGLSAAIGLSPISAKVEGLAWMKDAIQIVQKQLEVLKTN